MKKRQTWIILPLCIALLLGMIRSPGQISTTDAKTRIRLNKTKLTLTVGKKTQLKLKGTKKKVKWKSSKPAIAKISSSGKITAKKAGKTTITARCNGKKYTCKVTVKNKKNANKKPAASDQKTSEAASVQKLVNQERSKIGVDKLTLDPTLTKAAQKRTKEIATLFSHSRPDGSSCFTILDNMNISYTTCGENIAAGQSTPKSVMSSWMNSPGHKANILNASYGKIGVGYYKSTNTPYVHYWVQLFTN